MHWFDFYWDSRLFDFFFEKKSDCRAFSLFQTATGCRVYSHSDLYFHRALFVSVMIFYEESGYRKKVCRVVGYIVHYWNKWFAISIYGCVSGIAGGTTRPNLKINEIKVLVKPYQKKSWKIRFYFLKYQRKSWRIRFINLTYQTESSKIRSEYLTNQRKYLQIRTVHLKYYRKFRTPEIPW